MADYQDDPVTYYSDDDMVMKRKGNIPFGGLRSKKGHPIYSREDIREQYCINRKELQVFEDNIYHQRGLFGCLSTSHLPDNSPCKNSYLFSCMQKGKCSTDLEPEDSFRNRVIGNESKSSSARRYRHSRGNDYDDENVNDEDEDSDGGFKRRPKPRTCALLEQSKSSWSAHHHHGKVSSSSGSGGGSGSSTNFKAFERYPISSKTNTSQPCELNYVSGYKLNYKQIVSSNRPNVLEFKISKDLPGSYSSTSKSVDELNANSSLDSWSARSSALRPSSTINHPQSTDYHQNQCHPGYDGQQPQQPIRDERTKHVNQFNSNALCAQSQERLITGSFKSIEKCDSIMRNLNSSSLLANQSLQQLNQPYLQMNKPSQVRSMRRVVMKTHATQTETLLARGNQSNQPKLPATSKIATQFDQVSNLSQSIQKHNNKGDNLNSSDRKLDENWKRSSGEYDEEDETDDDRYYHNKQSSFSQLNQSSGKQSSYHRQAKQPTVQPQIQLQQQHKHHRSHHHNSYHTSFGSNRRFQSSQDDPHDNNSLNAVNDIGNVNDPTARAKMLTSQDSDDDGARESLKLRDRVRGYNSQSRDSQPDERQSKARTRVRAKVQRSLSTSIDDERLDVEMEDADWSNKATNESNDINNGQKSNNNNNNNVKLLSSEDEKKNLSQSNEDQFEVTHSTTSSIYNQRNFVKSISSEQIDYDQSQLDQTSGRVSYLPSAASSSSSHVIRDRNVSSADFRDIGLYRRHSVAADFISDLSVPVLYPPPGFEDRSSPTVASGVPDNITQASTGTTCENIKQETIKLTVKGKSVSSKSSSLESTSSSSSSSSSKACASGDGTDEGDHSLTEMDDDAGRGAVGGCEGDDNDEDDLDSPTLVSELSSGLIESSDKQKGKSKIKLSDNMKVSSINQPESQSIYKVIDNNCVNQLTNEGQVDSEIRLLSLPCSVCEPIIDTNENVDLVSPVKSEPSEVESSVQAEEFPGNRKTSGSGSSIYITAAEEEEEDDDDEDKNGKGKGELIENANITNQSDEIFHGDNNFQQINEKLNLIKGFQSSSASSLSSSNQIQSVFEDSSNIPSPPHGEIEYHPAHYETEPKANPTPTGLRVRHKSGSVVNDYYDDNNGSHELINRSSESETEIDSPSYWRKELIQSPVSEVIMVSGLSKSTPCDLEIDQDSELTHGVHSIDLTPIHEGFSSDPSSTATHEQMTIIDTNRVTNKLTRSPTSETDLIIKSSEEAEIISNQLCEKINPISEDEEDNEYKVNTIGQSANLNKVPSQVSEESSMENTIEVTPITLSSLPTEETTITSSSSSSTPTHVHTNDSIVIGEDSEGDPVESDDLEAFASSDKENGQHDTTTGSKSGLAGSSSSSPSSANSVAEKEFSLSALNIFCRRTLSGELSTVSEVSEEISGAIKSCNELDDLNSGSDSGSNEDIEPVPGLKDSTSTEQTLNNKEDDVAMIIVETDDYNEDDGQPIGDNKKISNEIYSNNNNNDRTEVSSPSSFSDSTTSGSFVIDGQTSEPQSILLDDGPVEVTSDHGENDIFEDKLLDQEKEVNILDNDGNLESKVIDKVESAGEKDKHNNGNKVLKRVQLSSEASILGESYEDDDEKQEEIDECKSNNNNNHHHGHRLYRPGGGGDKSSGNNNNAKEDEKEEDERRLDITGGESSQATEQDMARLEFSLTQQSSQEIDEESLSMGTHGNKDLLVTSSSSHHHSIDLISDGEMENVIEEEQVRNLTKNSDLKPTTSGIDNNNLVPQEVSTIPTGLISVTNKKLRFSESKKMFYSQTLGKSDTLDSGNSGIIETDLDKFETQTHVNLNEPKSSLAASRVPNLPMQSSLPSSGNKSTNDKKPAIERRTRSLTRSPVPLSCTNQFTCSHCGETSARTGQGHSNSGPNTSSGSVGPGNGRKPISSSSLRSPHPYHKSATIDDILSYRREDDEDIGVYSDAYKSCPWFYIGRRDELRVWCQRRLDKPSQSSKSDTISSTENLNSGDELVTDGESTPSEKGFKKHYEAVTHRMIHRKASIEMYKKILDNMFNVEKSVLVDRHNGEFGFRIHGSRPVVVSAIEKGTPAESCGLEVGDIVVSVNDINVLDASHSEVVRLAHAGSETLKLELVRTCQKLKSALKELKDDDEIFSGFLNRKSPSLESTSSSTSVVNVWKRRWFVLRPDYCLYWYNQPKTIDPLGVINLQNCTITLIPPKSLSSPSSSPTPSSSSSSSNLPPIGTTSTNEKRFVIRIDRIDGPSSYLHSTVEETVQRWLHHLSSAANKVSRTNSYIERTLRCIHIKPLSIKDADCRGYLGIFGQKRKLWKQRYFVLKDACLYSYIDMSSSTALGVFYLHGCKVQSTSLAGKRNTFEIVPWDRKMKHLWLMAESEIDKKRWLAALEYSIDRWIKLT
ncbi:serine-rich adhesin for platelets-like isoform X2 [Panonychus citri]|uniref:serine-rich adhesin for platelets-like isoform X2 n=1 Tax=Panonychus citri TaxID=50023 RepID=UPI002307F904|nr:serine-rich adhesin for platelets-like isoform X2 [Panonychus citri]